MADICFLCKNVVNKNRVVTMWSYISPIVFINIIHYTSCPNAITILNTSQRKVKVLIVNSYIF